MAVIDFNGTNYTGDWFTIWILPYIHIFGDMFFAVLLLIIAAGLYIGSDKNTFLVAIYCFVMAVIFGPIFGATGNGFFVSSFILLIAGLVFSMITYNAIIEKRQR
jgi:hypothetical protein